MDIDVMRTAVTVLGFSCFIGIVWWTVLPRNKARFDFAKHDVLRDDLRDGE